MYIQYQHSRCKCVDSQNISSVLSSYIFIFFCRYVFTHFILNYVLRLTLVFNSCTESFMHKKIIVCSSTLGNKTPTDNLFLDIPNMNISGLCSVYSNTGKTETDLNERSLLFYKWIFLISVNIRFQSTHLTYITCLKRSHVQNISRADNVFSILNWIHQKLTSVLMSRRVKHKVRGQLAALLPICSDHIPQVGKINKWQRSRSF